MLIDGLDAVADVFGVTPKTIIEWQDQGLPLMARGSFSGSEKNRYDTKACIAWLVDREVAKVRAESPADRLNKAKAESVEMDNAERRGLLVLASEIEPKLSAAVVNAREMFRNEPARLATAIAGLSADEIEDALRESFEAFLHRLANWGEALADDDDDEMTAVEADDD